MVYKYTHYADIAWEQDIHQRAKIMLALYGAAIETNNRKLVVGRKDGRLVMVAPPAIPTTKHEVKALLQDVGDAEPRIDILASSWSLGFGDNPQSFDTTTRVVRLVQIPDLNEVRALLVGTGITIESLGQEAVPEAIRAIVPFFEVPSVDIKTKFDNGQLTIQLTDYRAGRDIDAMTDGFSIVDYIGIDWQNDGHVLAPGWCFARSKQNTTLSREISHEYASPGLYHVVIHIIDAFSRYTSRHEQFTVVP